MAGHSKWSKIKRGKAIEDAKRGKIFAKISRLITIAVKEKGQDPSTNPKLRMAIEQSKAVNMPMENIERAIARGLGKKEENKEEEFICEAYGPGGAALIIEGFTDNKNRTLAEIRNILLKMGGKPVDLGGVRFLFNKKGVIVLEDEEKKLNKEELELKVIEAGAEDFKWRDENILEIYTKIEELERIKSLLTQQNIPIKSSSLEWVPLKEIEVTESKDKEQLMKLIDALDEHDDVNEIYSNLKL